MTAPTVSVEDCTLCGGRGAMQAERVPAGAERDRGVVRGSIHALRCPRCRGRAARLTSPGVQVTSEAVPSAVAGSHPESGGAAPTDGDWYGVGVVVS